ncbi:F-box protein At2g26160-like [Rosa chinensis]|uniref:F-box protein At2g26160-like n=1 Tax=Rosa chinensis TaxID=74649 RepID=UPI000D09250F|nr:F-box protein At2g26160-like [Rosa chinensis]
MSDRIRFASICKDWLSIAAAKPPPPPPVPESWLLFRGTSKFLSLPEERVYRFNNTIPPKEHIIVGASNGWVLTEDPECYRLLSLVNPILNAQIMLPILPRIHYLLEDMKKLLVVTFGDNSVLPAGVFIHTQWDSLIVCTCDNGPWRDALHEDFNDVLFYSGKIYTLEIQKSKTIVTAYSLNEQLQPFLISSRYVGQDIETETRVEACLVESRGDLLLVQKQFSQRQHTTGFQVFKLLLVEEDGSLRCVKLQSLRDQALFWDRNGCISLPAVGKFSLFKENHIYFINVLYEIGVYSLKDERIKRFDNTQRKFFRQESTWFVPTIKDTIVGLNRSGKQELNPLV